MMKNKFGKESRLYIEAKVLNGKTYLEDSYFTAPYKIAKPFLKVMMRFKSYGYVIFSRCYGG